MGQYTYKAYENCRTFETPHTPYPTTFKIVSPPCPWRSNSKRIPHPPSPPATLSNKLWNSNRTMHVNE